MLEEQPVEWMQRALIAEAAEGWAESEAMAHANARARASSVN